MVWTNIFLLSLLLIWIYSRFKSSVFISDINTSEAFLEPSRLSTMKFFFAKIVLTTFSGFFLHLWTYLLNELISLSHPLRENF